MAAEPSPLDPLLDLFVYAPIGMVYEYPDVLETLVKRGKSQVQLAKLFGQFAKSNEGAAGVNLDDALGFATQLLGKVVGDATEAVNSMLAGSASPAKPEAAAPAKAPLATTTAKPAHVPPEAPKAPMASKTTKRPVKAPIAGYDSLTARDIIALLPDLSTSQLAATKRYERSHKARKTVLAQLTKLGA